MTKTEMIAAARLGKQAPIAAHDVLNIPVLDFEFVSDFDIRNSKFCKCEIPISPCRLHSPCRQTTDSTSFPVEPA